MKKFYDVDLFSEEFLLKWGDNKLNELATHFIYKEDFNKKFIELSGPFIEWLR
jgi:hypothetical protein